MLKKIFITLALLFLINCDKPEGEFGWAITDDKDRDILEKEWRIVTDYTITRENLFFSPNDTIHYVYRITGGFFTGNEFAITLEKESLGFVEIDLKKLHLNPEDRILKDNFTRLDVGTYRINIVFDQEIIDSVIFEVLPKDGYSYQASDLETGEEEVDEIIRYSK